MLKLNKRSPQSACRKVDIQGLVNEVFCNIEVSTTNLEQNSLEVSLPLCFGNALCVLHDLTGSLGLASHLKVLGIFEHGHRHLLGWNFIAAPFNNFSGAFSLSKTELNAGSDEPNFPLDIIRAVLDGVA